MHICRTRHDGWHLFLDNGAWYRIDAGLVTTVNQEMSEIESSTLEVPSYGLREDEADYNGRFARN